MLRRLVPALAATAVPAKADLEGLHLLHVDRHRRPLFRDTAAPTRLSSGNTFPTRSRSAEASTAAAVARRLARSPGCPAYSGTDTVTASFLATDTIARPTATPTPPLTTTTGARPATARTARRPSRRRHSPPPPPTPVAATPFTGASTPAGQASGASGGQVTPAVGTQSGTQAAAASEVPAGAGPTARAGVAAVLGVAAAAAAVALVWSS
ncbi:hypothetical protein LX36DRAFT_672048 [Colletotrichum falcatum]|nr:hypothetical protein LX36DRAFT_672048 [Colletotrichum falcatum]